MLTHQIERPIVMDDFQEQVTKELLICIPAYNEEDNIEKALDDLESLGLAGIFDVLVIDDGSSDKTKEICKKKRITTITHIFNMGYGAALKTAYKYAVDYDYDFIIQMDADGQHDVVNIENIYNILKSPYNPPDIVLGSRFLEGSSSFRIPLHKKIVIKMFKLLIKATTKKNITDPTSGLQGLNRRAFEYYSRYNQFAIDYPDANMIIQMLLNDFDVQETPAVMHERLSGTSMHSGLIKPFKYIIKMLVSVIIIFIRESRSIKKRNTEKPGHTNRV